MFVQSHLTAQQFITAVFSFLLLVRLSTPSRERERERLTSTEFQRERRLKANSQTHLILQIHLLTGCTQVLLLTAQQQLNENGVFKFQRSPF